MTIADRIQTLRKQSGLFQERSPNGWMSPARLFPNGRAGYHLDKDTTPIPR